MGVTRANIGYHIKNQIEGDDRERVGDVREADIKVTTAELLALNATPKELVEAPGAGKVLQFMGAVGFLDYNSTTYTGNGILTIKYTNGSGTAVSDSVAGAALAHQADDCYEEFAKKTTEIELTANAALVLTEDTGEMTTGNSPLYIKIFYRILDFNY
jgi:hypothetical protein